MKLIFIDIETTGIPCPQSGLIQLAGLIEVHGQETKRFNFTMQPFPKDLISDEALEVNGRSRADISGYEKPTVVFHQLIELLAKYVDRYDKRDKFHVVGYNAKFDTDHLRSWFDKNNDRYFGSWFWHPPLDVMSMAAVALMERRPSMPNFKLLTVAQALGLSVREEEAHDALYDVELTRQMYQILAGDHKEKTRQASAKRLAK